MTDEAAAAAQRLAAAAAKLQRLSEAVEAGEAEREQLDLVVAEILGAQQEAFGERPRARRGEGARAKLLAYFQAHVGERIHGEQLRVISGIGEWARRVRELRVEQGYDIEEVATSTYVMHSPEPDIESAERWRLLNRIRGQEGSATSRIQALLTELEGEVVTRDQLDEVAKIKEGSRRVRELRDEQGWPINSHIDEEALSPGEYRLVSADPADRRDPQQRLYPEGVREEVFVRDDYACQECGRDRARAQQSGDSRFYLEIHHITAVADDLGELPSEELNKPANLVTLCHSCHKQKTRELQAKLSGRRRDSSG